MKNKILIRVFGIDDDPDMREQIVDILNNADINNYEMFEHPKEFFESLDEHVHIAIIDDRLGYGETGMGVMKKLLGINPYCYVIIISGVADPNLIIKYQEEGSGVFILKDNTNFAGKLVFYVNKTYRRIYSFLEFQERQLEQLKALKNG